MNISRFFGATNREALRQVRLALGPEALIISNQRVNGGVEILAADPTSVEDNSGVPASATITTPSGASADLIREMGAMRGALEGRIDELMWGNQLKQSPNAAILFQSLLGCGFSTALLRAMLRQLPSGLSMRAAQEWVRSELAKNLPVMTDEAQLWQPGLTLALVGPTGVGKTTTIAKLAARAVKLHGAENVALLTTDTYRIGAYEQLKIYGEKLRVLVKVINSADDLVRVLSLIPTNVTVLIDNVGVSQRDRYVDEQIAMLNRTDRDVKRLLVLNASSHGDTLDEVARSYSKDGGAKLQGCIITKADEASSLGAALDTAIRYRLSVHYISNGQKVPQDLLHLSADALVERAIVHEQTTKALYAPSQADFAALMSASQTDQAGTSKAGASVDALLGTLLAGHQNTQGQFQQNTFQSACDAVEDHLPVAEAWDIWNTINESQAIPLDAIKTHTDRMLRAVRIAGHAKADSPVVAMHGDSPVVLHNGGKAALRSCLLFTNSGNALVSAAQQVHMPSGWWCASGASMQQAPGQAEALELQINQLHNARPDWNLIHVFERGSQTLWNNLTNSNLNWLSRISAVSRFVHDGGRATASAIAKNLEHIAVENPAIGSGTDRGAPTPVALWVACEPVQLTGKAASQPAFELISVKVTSRIDGKPVKHLFGIAHMSGYAASTAQLASWLWNSYEARSIFRVSGRSWLQGGFQEGYNAVLQALLSTQSALAAWELSGSQAELVNTVAQLSGRAKPSMDESSNALIKLFALKKWLSSNNG